DAISALSCQAEQPGGVLLQDERPYVGPNVDLLEVRQPAVRRDHGVVRTEQYLALEQGVGVLDKQWREVLRRPTGQVDVDLRLVQRHRQRLLLPGEGGVRHDDRHVREVDRDVVQVQRVR